MLKMEMVLLSKVVVKIRDDVCNALRLICSQDFITGNYNHLLVEKKERDIDIVSGHFGYSPDCPDTGLTEAM